MAWTGHKVAKGFPGFAPGPTLCRPSGAEDAAAGSGVGWFGPVNGPDRTCGSVLLPRACAAVLLVASSPSGASLCLTLPHRPSSRFRRQAERRVRVLDAAASLGDLAALNSNRLEALKGGRKGQHSIRINDQWRICFEWSSGEPGPRNVEIVDYH